MTKHNETVLTTPTDQDIVVSRIFDAPRDLVWKAFTSAEHLKHWWGPTGWTLPVCELDFRVGGTWFYCMSGPDGMQSCGKAIYQNISAPESYVYTDAFADENGNVNESMPIPTITVEFIDLGGKTEVRNRTRYNTREQRDMILGMGVKVGITQTMDRLDDYLTTL